jgi:hypothetical protein
VNFRLQLQLYEGLKLGQLLKSHLHLSHVAGRDRDGVPAGVIATAQHSDPVIAAAQHSDLRRPKPLDARGAHFSGRALPQAGFQRKREKDAKLAQELGQLQPFIAVFPQECIGHLASVGPT